MKEKFTSSKTYRNLPCAHRQWKHEGHCATFMDILDNIHSILKQMRWMNMVSRALEI